MEEISVRDFFIFMFVFYPHILIFMFLVFKIVMLITGPKKKFESEIV